MRKTDETEKLQEVNISTRGVYSFKDEYGTYHVYKHSDNYPTGAAKALENTLVLAWQLPRYEADEMAAAFVAGNKLPYWGDEAILKGIQDTRKKKNRIKGEFGPTSTIPVVLNNPYPDGDNGGGVRLLKTGDVMDISPCDIEYRYEIYQGNDQGLRVKAFETSYWEEKKEKMILDCRLEQFTKEAKKYENKTEDSKKELDNAPSV